MSQRDKARSAITLPALVAERVAISASALVALGFLGPNSRRSGLSSHLLDDDARDVLDAVAALQVRKHARSSSTRFLVRSVPTNGDAAVRLGIRRPLKATSTHLSRSA
jgi:hypothetical protein